MKMKRKYGKNEEILVKERGAGRGQGREK